MSNKLKQSYSVKIIALKNKTQPTSDLCSCLSLLNKLHWLRLI